MTDPLQDEKTVPAARPGWLSGAPGQNLLVNYLSFLGGNVSAKCLSLLTVLLLTRSLGVEDFGRYSLVFSYWALLNTLVDFGSSQILAREIARNPEHPRPGIESVFYLRLLTCLLFLPVGFLLSGWLGLTPDLSWAMIYGILVGFEAMYDAYFGATMRLDQSARSRFFASLANLLLMGAAVLLKAPLLAIVLIGLSNPLIKFVFDFRYAPFAWKLQGPDWARIRQIAMDSWPLWLMGLQYILLARVDTFMLQVLTPDGPHQLGIYSAAFRFSEVMSLLVGALCPAMLPLLVAHLDEPERIRALAATSLRIILVVLIPMSLFIFWYAPWIVRLYGPGYEASADSMRILIWSQALVAINSLCYQILIIYNAQGTRSLLVSSVLSTGLNIALNYWLIPWGGALGASWATVATEIVIVTIMLLFMRRHTPVRLTRDVALLELLTLAACIPVWFMGANWGVISILLFLGMVWGFRLLTPEAVRQLVRERLHPVPPNPTSSDTPPGPQSPV